MVEIIKSVTLFLMVFTFCHVNGSLDTLCLADCPESPTSAVMDTTSTLYAQGPPFACSTSFRGKLAYP